MAHGLGFLKSYNISFSNVYCHKRVFLLLLRASILALPNLVCWIIGPVACLVLFLVITGIKLSNR